MSIRVAFETRYPTREPRVPVDRVLAWVKCRGGAYEPADGTSTERRNWTGGLPRQTAFTTTNLRPPRNRRIRRISISSYRQTVRRSSMDVSLPPATGDEYTFVRPFSREDARECDDISGDQQPIHTEPDDAGRLIAQGLLTATLPTKIGGELNYIARNMEFEFAEPAYIGERVPVPFDSSL
ncbi:hypothetical protein [Natrinema halophilum]|uniref:hypothetical protein n=1 Tax=Natrinema halophilum TaxID=1699371 RepID=UPI001F418CC2|nr:hypothetical protein [Natrinema halophilum]UHQ96049.1 hypothetical protein HYG82_20945 [Natrinema halophilum]